MTRASCFLSISSNIDLTRPRIARIASGSRVRSKSGNGQSGDYDARASWGDIALSSALYLPTKTANEQVIAETFGISYLDERL